MTYSVETALFLNAMARGLHRELKYNYICRLALLVAGKKDEAENRNHLHGRAVVHRIPQPSGRILHMGQRPSIPAGRDPARDHIVAPTRSLHHTHTASLHSLHHTQKGRRLSGLKLILARFCILAFLLLSALSTSASPVMTGFSAEQPAVTSTLTLTVTTTEATVVTRKITEQIAVFSTEALLATVLVLGLVVVAVMYVYSKRKLSGS